jgi:hypothetical protein
VAQPDGAPADVPAGALGEDGVVADERHVHSLVIDPRESYGINNPDDLEFARDLNSK